MLPENLRSVSVLSLTRYVAGEITFGDETGKEPTLRQGDKFLIRRGTDLTVSSQTYGLIFKCESQFMGQDIPITIHPAKL
jgi:hypothetical protein